MFENKLVGVTQATIPGAGPQLPNDTDRGRVHYIWEIYDPDTVKPGEAYRYVVPREKEVVLDPIGQVVYRVDHVNWESDLRSKLVAIYNTGNSGSGEDPISSIFGLPGGFQGEGVVGIDYSVRPNRAVIDGQIMAPNAAYALLYEGNIVGESGKVISVLYGSNQQLISNRVPVGLAAIHELTNKEIMVTQPFSVNRSAEELPDGSMCTLVWYDHAGNMIPKARMLSVQHTALLRDHQVGKRYIKNVELIAPWFMNSGDPKTLHVPVNTMLQNLAFRAVVHYSDGSKSDELPIDGNKVQLLGLNEHKPSSPGQRGSLTLVYNLDSDESIYEAQPGSPNQYRSSYWLLSTAFDGAYSPRLFTYPTWVSGQYVLKHFLTDLNRSFMIDVTNQVRINELSPSFRPTSYGVEQTLDLNLRLSDAVPTFEPMIMRQSVTVVLKTAGGDTGSKFDVRYSYDQRSYSDPGFRAINQTDGRQELSFAETYRDVEHFLDELYYTVNPGYNVLREKGPMTPTHFELITPNGRIYEYEVGQFGERFYLETQEPQGQTIYLRWCYQPLQGEKMILAMSGVSVNVKQGVIVEPSKAATLVLSDETPKNVKNLTPFTVKGTVYDQHGKPYTKAAEIKVSGGVKGDRIVSNDIDGNFEFITYTEKNSGTETLTFTFNATPDGYSLDHVLNCAPNEEQLVFKFEGYNPVKAGTGKPIKLYGTVTKEGKPVSNQIFYSSVDLDPETLETNTTDSNGQFVIERGRVGEEGKTNYQIVSPDAPNWEVEWVDDGSSYGDRIVVDKDFWTFTEGGRFKITGRVYDQNGDLAAGVPVSIGKGPNWEKIGAGISASNGIYSVEGAALPIGIDHDLVLWIDNAHVFCAARWNKEELVPSSIKMDENNPKTATVEQTVTLKGTVLDQHGAPVTGKTSVVDYTDPTGKVIKVSTNSSGVFSVENTRSVAGKASYGFALTGKPKTTVEVTWEKVKLVPTRIKWEAETLTDQDIGLSLILRGELYDQNGDPHLSESSFQVEVSNGTEVTHATAPGDGMINYIAREDTPGDYHYVFTYEGVELGSFDVKFHAPGVVKIMEMSTTSAIDSEKAEVYFYVKDSAGKVAKNTRVEGYYDFLSSTPNLVAYTDEEGVAIFRVPKPASGNRMSFIAACRSVNVKTALSWGPTTNGYEFINVKSTDNAYSDLPIQITGKLVNENGDPRANGMVKFYDYTKKEPIEGITGTNPVGDITVNVGPLTPGQHRIIMYTNSAKHQVVATWKDVPDPSRRLTTLNFNTGLPTTAKVGEKVVLTGTLEDQHGAKLDDGKAVDLKVTVYLDSGDKDFTAHGTGDGNWKLELDITEAGSWYMEFYYNEEYLTEYDLNATA